MSSRSHIRWRESDQQNINKEVRRFNSKLDRLAANNPGLLDYLPERQSVRQIKKDITTRAELNRFYNSVDRFFKKEATKVIESESGLKLLQYEKREIGIKVGIINRARTLERNAADVSTDKGTMGSIKANNLTPKPFDINKISPGKEWQKFKESVNKQSRARYKQDKMELYKQNYLDAIRDKLGAAGEKLYNKVKNIPAETIYKNFYDDPILQMGFTSAPLPAQDIADEASDHWDSVLSGENLLGDEYEE